MTQQSRPSFELLLGEVSLKAPETPLYLRLASQVLEARRLELENGHGPEPEPEPTPPASPSSPSAAVATLEPPVEASAPEAVVVETAPEPVETDSAPSPSLETTDELVETISVVEEAPEPEPAPVEAAAAEEPPAPAMTPSIPSPEPAPAASAAEAPVRRARWFRGQLPVVNFEDGTSRVMDSLDALKDLLRSRGLTPHPRGDASMLLWQVRNRLGLSVDQVDA